MSEIEKRKEPFVPDPNRIVFPVDFVTSHDAALAKFHAETRLVVGAQLTRRIVDDASDLEDQIRWRARDEAHYVQLSHVVRGYMADAMVVRHHYMNPEEGTCQ